MSKEWVLIPDQICIPLFRALLSCILINSHQFWAGSNFDETFCSFKILKDKVFDFFCVGVMYSGEYAGVEKIGEHTSTARRNVKQLQEIRLNEDFLNTHVPLWVHQHIWLTDIP